MNDNLWKIEGYLLGDPHVDRAQFEQDMLDNPELALKVAEVAEQLESIARVASKQRSFQSVRDVQPASHSSHSGASRFRNQLLILSATAAALLLAIFVLPFGNKQGGNRLDELANNWLAMETESSRESDFISIALANTATSDEPELHVPAVSNNSTEAASESESEDWLIDSAVSFFSDTGF